MKRKRYSEEQTVSILNEREAGRLGGRPGPQARRRRTVDPPLEIQVRRHDGARPEAAQASSKENLRLKRMVADLSLDKQVLEDVIEMSKSGDARRQEEGGGRSPEARPASERRICRLLGLHRSTARSRPGSRAAATGRWRTACASWPGGIPLRLPDAAPHAQARGLGGDPQAHAPRLLSAWPASPNQAAQEAVAASGPDGDADPAERALADRLHVRPAGQRPPLAHPERRRRLLQAVRRPAGGHLDHRGPAGALPGRAGQGRGDAQGRRLRQRPRAHQQGDALLERAVRRGLELHPARQAHPERLRGRASTASSGTAA